MTDKTYQGVCPSCNGDPSKVPWHGHGVQCGTCGGTGKVDITEVEWLRLEVERLEDEIIGLRAAIRNASAALDGANP